MFIRGRIGPLPSYLANADLTDELSAIEENWIKPGKMLAWNLMGPSEFRILGPNYDGAMVPDLHFGFTAFPTLENFIEFLDASPEHVAIHKALMQAHREGGGGPLNEYGFLATSERERDIRGMRAELRAAYRRIEAQDWLGMPPGFGEKKYLGDED